MTTETDHAAAPPASRRRRLAPGARLEQILDAALAEFAAKGYAGASMAATAARAGIAKGLIYHYFPGKAELFRAVIRSCLQPAFAEAEELIAAFPGPRAELLRALIAQAYARIARERRERVLFKLLLVESGRFPELAELYRTEVLGRAIALIRGLLADGAATGEFRPEAAMAEGMPEVLLSPVITASIWQMMLGEADAPSLEAMCRAQTELALRGLAAKEG